jgi:DNA-binding GntR family transcriptional regulator
MDALLAFYRDHPGAGPTEAAQAVNVSRQTVYTYLAELEAGGRISRNNGSGVEVVG